MTIISKPKPVGLSDPSVLRKTQQNLAQAAELAKGKPTLTNNGQELILPSTTVAVSNSTVSATTSANNQPSDTVTVYSTPGNIFVSSIDQTVRSTTINQVGVSSIISGNNITISSTGNNGTGGVTINATASASLGNVTFDDINIIGTGNLHLQPDPANTGSYLDIFLTSGPDLHLVASASANLILGKDNQANVMTSWDGNVYIQSWDTGTGNVGGVWTFGGDGTTIFPTLTTQRGDNPSGTITGQTLLFGDTTQEAIISTPDGIEAFPNSQRLVINPGEGYGAYEGGDIYLWAGRGGNASGSGGDIKIRGGQGGANTSGGSGGDGGYIRIEAGDAPSTGGYPGYINITGGYSNNVGGDVNLTGGQGNVTGGIAKIYGGYGTATGGNVDIWGGASGNGQANEGHVNIQTGGNTWTFAADGNLTLPDATVQSTAWTGITGFGEGFSLTAADKIVTNKLYSTNLTQPTQHYRLELDTNGVVHLPDQSIINGATLKTVPGNYAGITAGPASPAGKDEDSWVWVDKDGAWISTKESTTAYTWHFDNDGNLTLPGNIVMNDGINGTISSEGNVNVSANTNVWEFSSDGNLTLSDLGVIWDNGGLTTLQAGTDGAQIGSNDGQSYVIANTSGTYMQTLADSTNNIWTFALSGGYAPPILLAPPGTPVAGTYYTADGISWDPATKSGVVPYPVFYDGVAYQSLY